jgi:hypothetical protein
MRTSLIALVTLALGCHRGPARVTSITVEPADQTLIIDGTTPASSAYEATGHYDDGHSERITDVVQFSVADASLGSFATSSFSSTVDHGGRTVVTATLHSLSGSTSLTLQLRQRYSDPGSTLPASPSTLFGGGDSPGAAPELVYPNDGVLVPPNLGRLEFHVRPGPGNALYLLALHNDRTDIEVYFGCANPVASGCVYSPDATVWRWLAETNRGGPPLTVTVRGTDGHGGAVGTSNGVALSVAQDDVAGGLYYWTTAGQGAIMRVDFAADAPAAKKFLGPEIAGNVCVGCHALSRDGSRLVAEAGGQNDGRQLLVDVAHSTLMVPFGSTPRSIFESWEPSGARYVGVYADAGASDYGLQLFDGASAALLGSIGGTGSAASPADHPDWSPDGKAIAYVQVGIAGTSQRMWQGAIRMVTTSDGIIWSAPVELVAAQPGKNHYYPAFSPDGALVVYDESTCPPGQGADPSCDADSDPSATLMVVARTPGAPPLPLAHANAPGRSDGGRVALTNSFPKWSPFVFRGSTEFASRLMWLTFSSTRNYGLRPPPPSSNPGESARGTLVWMVAIDPDRAATGVDPSYAAFALPFQDVTTSNHIAQWTTAVVSPIQ